MKCFSDRALDPEERALYSSKTHVIEEEGDLLETMVQKFSQILALQVLIFY